MRRRVFLAVNLDSATITELEKLAVECGNKLEGSAVGIRFLKPKNWHITLSFLGYQNEDDILRIIRAAKEVASGFPLQEIEFDGLLYGPPGKDPRMIWISADKETSGRLSKIKDLLEDKLGESGVVFRREKRKFDAHITLARFRKDLRRSSLPLIDKSLRLRLEAPNLDLMESGLKRGGAEYTVLQKFPFSD